MPILLDSLISCSWSFIESEQLSAISSRIVLSFPADIVVDADNVLISFMTLYRRICHFSVVRSNQLLSVDEEYQKQAIYIRTYLALMLKSSENNSLINKIYEDIVKTVHNIVLSRGDTTFKPSHLVHELTSFWLDISNPKLRESLICVLCNWLENNIESQLVLILMQTVIKSLSPNLIPVGLRVIEKCITCYFSRKIF
ncbi:unnamed protein product [Dracunculus medinensis]|uniref:MOR2-PAG1_N domain-containing protein n=1 Tax=Dracunculus medinensis TaxID=318479 RepID=A0A0N4URF3_DRAME|nr:unnamed protein product [Dracunculus medinensis]